jgi:hypothetical protein
MARKQTIVQRCALTLAVGSILGLMAGCAPESPPQNAAPTANTATATTSASASGLDYKGNEPYASVNGEPLDRALILAYAKQRGFDPNDPAQLTQAADKLSEFMMLAQAARREGLPQNPDFALEQLKFAASAYLQHKATQPPITEAELQNYYDAQVKLADGVEYNLEQLAFDNEVSAHNAEAMLAAGKPFAQLLTELKGQKGVGEARALGWTNLALLPEPVRAPLQALKAGGAMKLAVQHKGVWHLLNVVETRALTVQPFADVKSMLQKRLEQERAASALEQARSTGVITTQ